MATYKFRFRRERFACNVKVSGGYVAVDVDNGYYQTDNEEVGEYLTKRSEEPNSDIISLNKVDAILDEPKKRVEVVRGARQSKDSK